MFYVKYLCLLLSALYLGACHLMVSNDVFDPQGEHHDETTSVCAIHSDDEQAWWQGEWTLDTNALTQNTMSYLEDSSPNKALAQDLSLSLAAAIHIQVQAQQAIVKVDQVKYRLATSPLANDQGVRLVGTDGTSLLWCEQDRIFWSFAEGQPMPIKRKK